ncbi:MULTISPECIES: formate dehydrogenase subunit delta [Hyphomicrobiales]|jgi:formate dehydrogenase subunit delta|uniref:formate dehydrogenase subunit delta n=1 Tax=Hyphomicrobiales TaxID=356 RepID=UPI00036883F1|nr:MULTISPECIES: formate dehydrogenase subunit delta [Phyllobacteriaceae]MCX8570341.1 formate dehydrogenase subunit delta [Aminobacter sp. MET-1]
MSHDDEDRMSTKQKLVYMANQIATFFDSKPHDEGVAGIAEHINKFWDPRMRRQFFELVDAGGVGMKPTVIEASVTIRRPKQDAA